MVLLTKCFSLLNISCLPCLLCQHIACVDCWEVSMFSLYWCFFHFPFAEVCYCKSMLAWFGQKEKKVCTSEILLKSFHFLSTISAHCLLFLSRQIGYWALLSSICRSMTWWKHFSLKLVPLFGLKKLTWEWCWK